LALIISHSHIIAVINCQLMISYLAFSFNLHTERKLCVTLVHICNFSGWKDFIESSKVLCLSLSFRL